MRTRMGMVVVLVWMSMFANQSAAWAFDVRATFKKIDIEKRSVVVTANGREHTARVAEDVKVIGADGNEIADGLKAKEIKEGATCLLTVEPVAGQPTVKRIDFSPNARPNPVGQPTAMTGRDSIGLKPLTDMTAEDRYKGEDGGLYGGGRNEPPESLRAAAARETSRIQPLDDSGQPSPSGRIVLVSISMSNATQEFSRFKRLADEDPDKSAKLTIVDCAQGGQAMAEWAGGPRQRSPWEQADQRLSAAKVSPQQVQVAWIKLANMGPRGELAEHGKTLQQDTLKVIQLARQRFPNLRVAYLTSRIYGGYSTGALNPEPFAYEGAFPVRWLIQQQASGDKALNFDPAKGDVKAPVLLWGAYLWADGVKGRQSDDLVWKRDDLLGDGTHPSDSGRDKVARLLLKSFKEDPFAKQWFVAKP